MHRLQEIVRLHRFGRSGRQIARQLRMGRETVQRFIAALDKGGLLDGTPDELPSPEDLKAATEEHVPHRAAPQQTSSVLRWRSQVEELLEKGCGPKPIHDHLRLHEPDYAGSLSAIKRLCLRIKRERGPTEDDVAIPVVTDPGEVAQVDFGYCGMCYDSVRGVRRKAWGFVMTLAHSRYMFCDIVFDQKTPTWMDLHVQAFEFFGGVPRVIVPDNLKAAVIRAAFGVAEEPVLNRSYRELARYYGFQVDPTPPRSPEKKGKVERDVKYVKGSFFRTWESVNIDEDRKQLRRWVVEIANKRRHGTTGRVPVEVFEEEERAALKPLPKRRWEPVVWMKPRLHRDSHVQIDGAFYSAPWRFLGEQLWARCTPASVSLYWGDEHLWTHARARRRGERKTVDEHLPDRRRDLRHRSREYWIRRARRIGPEVEELVAAIFGSDDVLLKLRKVQAVVSHLESFPADRARRAAMRALHFGSLEYRAIKSILAQALDLEPLPEKRTRDWSQGSRFARNPAKSLLTRKERHHGRP